jgi:hypothetical protein
MYGALTAALCGGIRSTGGIGGSGLKEMWVDECDMYCNLEEDMQQAAAPLPAGYTYYALRCAITPTVFIIVH